MKIYCPRSSESRVPFVFLTSRFGFEWWTCAQRPFNDGSGHIHGAPGRFIKVGWLCLRWGAA